MLDKSPAPMLYYSRKEKIGHVMTSGRKTMGNSEEFDISNNLQLLEKSTLQPPLSCENVDKMLSRFAPGIFRLENSPHLKLYSQET